MSALSFAVLFALVAGVNAQCGSPQRDHANCASWANSGFCTNSFYTPAQKQMYCGTRCGLCPGTVGACSDSSANCGRWAAQGFCTNAFYTPAQRSQYCGRTCNLCATTAAPTAAVTTLPTTTPAAAACTITLGANPPTTVPRTTDPAAAPTAIAASPANAVASSVVPVGCTLNVLGGAATVDVAPPGGAYAGANAQTATGARCLCP